jgi:hypothetical protein
MCFLGYSWRSRPMEKLDWKFSDAKLMRVSVFLVVVGAYFFFAISRLPEELTKISQWTGLPVAYLFFAQVLCYGFAIAFFQFARTGSKRALAIAGLASLFYLDRIFLAGRRGVTLEFVFIILLSLWFGRRFALPRPVVLAGLLFGILALHSTGDYRAATSNEEDSKWEQLKNIALLGNLKQQLTKGGNELENAAYLIAGTEETRRFDFGAFHWNTLVFNFVPAQLLGEEFKRSLMIQIDPVDTYEMYGYTPIPGVTITGMVDAFGSFWYLGCLKFFVIGLVLRRLYAGAMNGHFVAAMFYLIIITNALHCITHHTQWFVSPWVHLSIFLLPARYFYQDSKWLTVVGPATTGVLPAQSVAPAKS